MKSENAIIILLIVIILAVAGAYLFFNGHGLALNSNDGYHQQNANYNHPSDTVATGGQSSGQSSNGGSNSQPASADSGSGSDSASSSDSSSGSDSSSAPQAGQPEGTYDPTDFD